MRKNHRMKIEDEIKGRFRNEYHKGTINLIYTVKHLMYEFERVLKKYGLTEPQYNILRVLRGYRKDGPLSIGFLKERMLDKNSDVSRIVDKLHSKAYVDRKENPDDRRQKEIEITKKGMDLLATMDDCDRKTETLLENLNPEEVMELNTLLDKIRSN